MNFKIIGDSCCDLLKEDKEKEYFTIVPLTIHVDEFDIVDDETFDQADFLRKIKASPNCAKSSCPAPEDYMKLFENNKNCYVVTLSAQLSGSYNSAELAKRLYLEENPNANIYVFNSRSAGSGEMVIAKKIEELALQGKEFSNVVKEVEEFINNMRTFFVLETLDTLKKNGRLSNIKAFLASALNIKPVMGGDKNGEIYQAGQARGMNKALLKLADIVQEECKDLEGRVLAISHCNCKERAMGVKEEFMKRFPFREAIVADTAGISSFYANEGGVIIAF